MKLFTALLLAAAAAIAQTAPAPATYQPNYFLLGGVSYDYYGQSSTALTEFGAQIANNTYSVTDVNIGNRTASSSASLATGVLRVLMQTGNWTVGALGQAGVTTGSGVTLGTFGGGPKLAYDVGQAFKKGHFWVSLSAAIQSITATQVKPVFQLSFGPTF